MKCCSSFLEKYQKPIDKIERLFYSVKEQTFLLKERRKWKEMKN